MAAIFADNSTALSQANLNKLVAVGGATGLNYRISTAVCNAAGALQRGINITTSYDTLVFTLTFTDAYSTAPALFVEVESSGSTTTITHSITTCTTSGATVTVSTVTGMTNIHFVAIGQDT